MFSYLFRTACCGLVASAAAIGIQSSADAGTLQNTYYGGLDDVYEYGPTVTPEANQVIGDASVFGITNAVASFSPLHNGTLTVTINTNFAGVPGTAAADGTNYGSLFIGSASTWNADHTTGGPQYINDQYHPGEWLFAVNTGPTTSTTATGSSGTGGLYQITGTQTPYIQGTYNNNGIGNSVVGGTNTTVVQYYQTTNGQVVMSNVGGNPITYPLAGAPGWWFRQGQAVAYAPTTPTSGQVTGSDVTWSVVNTTSNPGSVTYTLTDFDALGLSLNSISISWAMTCANDIIQGVVDPTPLPGALPLFAAGLGVLGFAASRRRRNATTAKVAG